MLYNLDLEINCNFTQASQQQQTAGRWRKEPRAVAACKAPFLQTVHNPIARCHGGSLALPWEAGLSFNDTPKGLILPWTLGHVTGSIGSHTLPLCPGLWARGLASSFQLHPRPPRLPL